MDAETTEECKSDCIVDVTSETAKRRRFDLHEEMQVYLENMPCCDYYEKSYMHRDVLIDLSVTPRTDFIVTSSVDGHVKFWKKLTDNIEFVKHFRAHLGKFMYTSFQKLQVDRLKPLYNFTTGDFPGVLDFLSFLVGAFL